QFRVEDHQRAREAELHCVRLAHHTAATHGADHVESLVDALNGQRTLRCRTLLLGHEILVVLLFVHGELARTRTQTYARNRRLPPTRSVILNQLRHIAPDLSRLLAAFTNPLNLEPCPLN